MEKAGRPVRIFELTTGHSPNLTAATGVVDTVDQIVKSQMGCIGFLCGGLQSCPELMVG